MALDGNVLDVGCNTGFMISFATGARIHGVDHCAALVQEAQHLCPQGVFKTASFYEIPWPDGFFDGVVLSHVLEIPDSCDSQVALLAEVWRVLKTGGCLLFSTPNNDHLVYRHRKEIGHGVTRDELRELLRRTGFNGDVRVWNPVPSMVQFLPEGILEKIPEGLWPFLFVPSRLLSFVPNIYPRLKRKTDGTSSRFKSLWGIAEKVPLA